jgi:uncharacterized OB-fold protein
MTFLAPQKAGMPFAPITPTSQPYWEGTQAGELRYQRCNSCEQPNFPPTENCRNCVSTDLRWEVSSGTGTLYSWTAVWRPVTPAFEVPYAPAIIDVAEGFRLVSNLVEVDIEQLEIDMPLVAVFHPIDDRSLLYFKPA